MRRVMTCRPHGDRTGRRSAMLSQALAVGLAVGLLTVGLAACGGSPSSDDRASTPTSRDTGTPETSANEEPAGPTPDTTFETVEPVVSPFVTARVGDKVARRVTADAVGVLTNYSYAEEVVAAVPPEQMKKVLSLTGSMTASGARYWRGYVRRAAIGTYEQMHNSKVFTLVWWGLMSNPRPNKPSPLPKEGPVVVNPRFRQVRTTMLDDGRIAVHAVVSLDLRHSPIKGRPVMLGVTGTHTLWYVHENGKWLLDGWQSGLKSAKAYAKDPYAR